MYYNIIVNKKYIKNNKEVNNMTNTAIILGYMQLNNLDPTKII